MRYATLIARMSFHIFIVEQSLDGRKFNRGKLLNAGFDMARDDFDVFIFHDVDLLPGDDLGELYAHAPRLGPMHIARVWGRYNENPHYFGGIVVFTRQQFVKINGFPNNFWGWGGEDNELYSRVVRKKLTVQAPIGCLELQEKLAVLRASKWKCTVKRELLKEHHRTWKTNGLKSLNYEYVDAESLNDCCTKITVHLGPNGHWSDARSSLERPETPAEVSSSETIDTTDRSQASEANGSIDQGHGEEMRAPQDASSSDETHEEALAIQ
ncbi:hypothetical protein BBJ28_00013797 [Nothophytophthora sp. Chile5]|nr:hypothetical protein BBJ28_00013797 [Nothophytophthora sp. Chile5]